MQTIPITLGDLFSILAEAANPKPPYPVPVFLLYEWQTGTSEVRSRLTAGLYPNAKAAMEACQDVLLWIEDWPGHWRSEDGRRIIEAA